MKPTFFLLLLCAITTTKAVAQEYEYVPFPTENALWKTDMWSFQCHPNTSFCEQFAHGTGDSLIINDTTYIGIHPANVQGSIFPTPIAAIRMDEDSVKKKVWIRATSGNHQNEILLYDFNLIIGDTIPFSSWSTYTGSGGQNVSKILTVAAIDTVEIVGHKRKRFHLLQDGLPLETQIIEGIGSTSGLGPDCEFWRFEHWWDLQCFLLEGEFVYGLEFDPLHVESLQYHHSDYQYCQALTNIDNADVNLKPSIHVFPNPVHGSEFQISLNERVKAIAVYDLFGRSIPISWSQLDNNLSISGNPSTGLKLMQILTNNNHILKTKILWQP